MTGSSRPLAPIDGSGASWSSSPASGTRHCSSSASPRCTRCYAGTAARGPCASTRSRTPAAPGFESLVGALVHSLPVVVDADGDTPFTELVARTASAWDGAWSDRELPLARIVEAVNLPRNQAVDPLFQVVLDFDDVDLVCPLTGLETAVDPLFPGGAQRRPRLRGARCRRPRLGDAPRGRSRPVRRRHRRADPRPLPHPARRRRRGRRARRRAAAGGRPPRAEPARERVEPHRNRGGAGVDPRALRGRRRPHTRPRGRRVWRREADLRAARRAHANQLAHELRTRGVGADAPVARRRGSSGSARRATSTSWSACSASSRPAAPTSPSIPRTRPSASHSSCATRAPGPSSRSPGSSTGSRISVSTLSASIAKPRAWRSCLHHRSSTRRPPTTPRT